MPVDAAIRVSVKVHALTIAITSPLYETGRKLEVYDRAYGNKNPKAPLTTLLISIPLSILPSKPAP